MTNRTIHYAGIDYYDRTRPLVDGTVPLGGLSLRFTPLPGTSHFMGFAEAPEADAIEMSLGQYLSGRGRGDTSCVAIPVFPSRAFRLDGIYVLADGDIREPKDLIGRRMGCSHYSRTAAIWQRGVLQQQFGVRPQDLRWTQLNPGLPPASTGIEIQAGPAGATLPQLLLAGEIDAFLFGPELPAVPGSERIAHLFPNWVEVEADYYRRTGILPIMHLVALKREAYERDPASAVALFEAFAAAKRAGWERVRQATTPAVMFPWISHHLHQIAEVFGPDHWPYGLEKNRAVLDAACGFHHEQGLSPRRLQPEELFVEETLGLTE